MQPDFQRTIIIATIVAVVIIGTGATLLVMAFRSFATAKRGDVKHIVLLVAAIGFMLVCSVGLLVWSMISR
ncbi:MAG TPA: hypothetical protein VLV78_12570 [Thermoanaerobaculia bacterium]|nr:hypothetical protein [Thermoanaerobaculia bacterium]